MVFVRRVLHTFTCTVSNLLQNSPYILLPHETVRLQARTFPGRSTNYRARYRNAPDKYIFSENYFGDFWGKPENDYAVVNGLFAEWPVAIWTEERRHWSPTCVKWYVQGLPGRWWELEDYQGPNWRAPIRGLYQ